MKAQVTIPEQSAHLLELGVPAEAASMEWKSFDGKSWDISTKGMGLIGYRGPAFTASDLFNLLPATIYDKDQEWHLFVHKISQSGYVIIYYEAPHTNRYSYNTEGSYINALYDMIVKLITTGHKISI